VAVNGVEASIIAAGIRATPDPDLAFLRLASPLPLPVVPLCKTVPSLFRVSSAILISDAFVVNFLDFEIGL
jgi:hypothetical protein